jgi:hypothetical protein
VPVKDCRHVFHDDELWSYQLNDSDELIEQAGTGARSHATTFACDREVLTRESPDHNVS